MNQDLQNLELISDDSRIQLVAKIENLVLIVFNDLNFTRLLGRVHFFFKCSK